jgi:sugar transferase (PEP-CTERM/EpsH1 system associated)
MNILIISVTFPYPPTLGGTQVRTFYLLKHLQKNHHITLVTQRDRQTPESDIAELRNYVDELVLFDRPPEASKSSNILPKIQRFSQFLLQGTPPHVHSIYSNEMQTWIDNFVQAGKCDAITCEHSVNEIYVRPEYQKQVRTIVDVHSSVYGTCKSQLETNITENRLRDTINLPLLRRYEQKYCQKFSAIVVTTEEDKLQLQALNLHQKITVIPNGVDLDAFPPRPQDPGGHRLIFIGAMDYIANVDAVCYFSTEIFPEIKRLYPDAVFDIVGSRPTAQVLALKDQPGINVTGRVPVMADYLNQAAVCVVPLRLGFGIKNKTLEAMAAGVPVVGSDRGLEGLAVDGENTPLRALRANQPAEYVTAISQLFTQPELRAQLSRHGRELVEAEFTWQIAGQRYEQACLGKD